MKLSGLIQRSRVLATLYLNRIYSKEYSLTLWADRTARPCSSNWQYLRCIGISGWLALRHWRTLSKPFLNKEWRKKENWIEFKKQFVCVYSDNRIQTKKFLKTKQKPNKFLGFRFEILVENWSFYLFNELFYFGGSLISNRSFLIQKKWYQNNQLVETNRIVHRNT